MRIKIADLSISLSLEAIKSKKKDEWLKEAMTPFGKAANADEIKAALSDAYDKIKTPARKVDKE